MAVPSWTQNSGYKLGTLQERVTTSITLPIAPGSASGTGFDPSTTAISLPAQTRLQNSSTINITKTWTQGGSPTINYTVTFQYVGNGNKYFINGVQQPTLELAEGNTYIFDWSPSPTHPVRFSTTAGGTHSGGTEYTTGVTVDMINYRTTIVVPASAPTLYYYCQYHAGMGGQANTPSTPGVVTYTYPMAIRVPTIPALLNKRVPVAILLHGSGGNGPNEINSWQNYLGDHIIVAPTGYDNAWNVAHETSKAPDIEMLTDLITLLKDFVNVDNSKIRIIGFSNGAALANRAYVQIDDPALDTIVTNASQFFDPMLRNNTFYIPSGQTGITNAEYNTAKTPLKGRRFLNIHSENDNVIPYAGGSHAFGYSFYSAQQSVFEVAKSQGYTGGIIPDVGGIYYGVTGVYYYSYLAGQVIHYKTPAGHDVLDYMKQIVTNYLTYTQESAPNIFLESGSVTSINLNTDVITLISGELPGGMRLLDNKIVGTPFEVQRDTEFEFVLRAKNDDGVRDRTFKIEIQGPDEPVWTTAKGKLPLGPNNSFYILDSSIVNFQLNAIDDDLPTGQSLEYFIADGDGTLPPGIQLTTDGRLVGVVDPILALDKRSGNGFYDTVQYDQYAFDFGMRSANGFESYYYDTQGYDYAIPTQSPKKLNRTYEFSVSVSDGDTITKREFQIFLVGDDFLRADNTIMQVGTGIFTADNTYLRTPVWLTPADLGFKRANNYVTLFLDVFDPNTVVGVLNYQLQSTNEDGSASTLPPGMTLDVTTGEIAGRVPYQPAVTKEYKFTIKAIRYTSINSVLAEKAKTFTVKILGEVESTINWNTAANLGSINANFISTFSVNATTSVPRAILLYNLVSGTLPPGLALNFNGEIVGKVRQFSSGTNLGLTTIDKNEFTLDGGTTSIDRKFTFTVQARDRFGFSATTREFNIVVSDPDNVTFSNLFVKPFLKPTQRTAYNNFIGDPNVFTPASIYRPNDPEFGLQKDIKMLVYAGIETKEIRNYISVTRKNHKRKRFKLGAVKSALAKKAGSTDTVYEVVYIEVIDPVDVTTGTKKVQSRTTVFNKNKITVDSVELETSDDVSKEGSGLAVFEIRNSIDQIILVRAFGNDLEIIGRNGSIIVDANGTIQVTTRSGAVVTAGQIATTSSDPFRFRPNGTPIKVSSDAIKVSDSNDQSRYISNITNMRDNLRSVGTTEANFLPLWMSTAQTNTVEELGYVTAIPLCYCKPGTSAQIMLNIKNNGFDFRQLDFEIDRYVIDNTTGNSNEQYIPFGNYSFNV
mgnify:CR=1 FL=1